MLVLSRKLNTTIVIDGGIRVTVVGIRGNQVRLGIEAPDRVGIYREELCAGDGAPERARGGAVGSTTDRRSTSASIEHRESR
jgi:carbon storage regulator